ncbi:hypothetical protein DU002_13015 [Corallincola holothuriorum]|uniref:Uncharacterized protein n=1 Tax=Corallincola holothuriorum TaxID=2282215 RepID=A0A368NHA4_9GAMM|nr:hypothetical protein DU002_13015 [Corallincola holothuriorum]
MKDYIGTTGLGFAPRRPASLAALGIQVQLHMAVANATAPVAGAPMIQRLHLAQSVHRVQEAVRKNITPCAYITKKMTFAALPHRHSGLQMKRPPKHAPDASVPAKTVRSPFIVK